MECSKGIEPVREPYIFKKISVPLIYDVCNPIRYEEMIKLRDSVTVIIENAQEKNSYIL